LLDAAGDVHRPAAVAEVALELPEHRRGGVAGEGKPAVGLKAGDGLEQSDHGDLGEVLQWLAAGVITPRDAARERLEALDDLLQQSRILLLAIATQELIGRERARWLAISRHA